MRKKYLSFSVVISVILGCVAFTGGIPCLASAENVATLYSSEGSVQYRSGVGSSWADVKPGQSFAPGDSVRTLISSRAAVRFKSGYLVRLAEKTNITFNDDPSQKLEEPVGLLEGILYFFSRKPERSPKVTTGHLSASVRGTEFVVEARSDSTIVSVLDGAVFARNGLGELSVGKGEQVVAEKGKSLTHHKLVDLTGVVQWVVSFPSLVGPSDIPGLGQPLKSESSSLSVARSPGNSWHEKVQRALTAEEQSRIDLAIAELGAETKDATPGWYVYRASLAFRVGQVDYAEECLNKARDLSATLGEEERTVFETTFLSLRALSAIVSGRVHEAEGLVERAKNTSPNSLAAWLADSYLTQALANIPGAISSARRAMEISPDAQSPKLRVAELLLASGENGDALDYITEVLAGNPQSGYATALRGFAYLAEGEAKPALTAFESAVRLDPSVGLYRLGMGLAIIKKGDLSLGRKYLEEAANLEPNYSLIRSYLGKAYFEEEKEALSGSEFDRAIALDKEDPTPYLYRSQLDLSEHKPVAALKDLEKSIELNDNRSVFRSRLLLDQDLGARTANLGRVYNALGFSELARLSAMRALSKDYSNYSAHFLLSESYRDKHLTDRARVTESLIGRLLVPMTFNANSVQSSGQAGLNEYSNMFDRPDSRTSVSTSLNTQTETLAGQLSYASSGESVGYNLGYSGSNREGLRSNDYERLHQGFFQGQYQAAAKDTMLWDSAVSWESKGDTVFRFDPMSEDLDYQSKLTSYLGRLGYRHDFGNGVQLIAQALVNRGDTDIEDEHNMLRLRYLEVLEKGRPISERPFSLDAQTSEDIDRQDLLSRADAQVLWNSDLAAVVLGVSGKYQNVEASETGVVTDPGTATSLEFIRNRALSSAANLDEDSLHLFGYSTWHLTDWLDADTGLVYTRSTLGQNADNLPFVDSTFTRDSLDPKVGLVSSFSSGTTVRAAYTSLFDFTGRGGIGQLEPTSVGGFNQLYDAVPGTDQEMYSVGLDQKFSRLSYLGGAFSYRKLSLRSPVFDGGFTFDRNSGTLSDRLFAGTDVGRADISRSDVYYYQILTDSMVLALDYAWEFFDEGSVLPDTKTDRVKAHVRYFHPSGAFAHFTPSWRYQERGGDIDPKTTKNFAMLDLGVGYEFAARHGRIQLDLLNLLDQDFKYSPITDEQNLWPRIGGLLSARYNF